MGEWKRINRKEVFRGHRVKVFEDELKRPDGKTVLYDLVENRNGAAVLLVDDEENLILVSQYRNVLNRDSLEIPAGSMDEEDADPEMTAIREAEEETGFVPGKMRFVSTILASSGLFTEQTSIYIGTGLKQGEVHRDPDEFLTVRKIPMEEVMKMIFSGEICDGKTILAVYAYRDMIKNC